MKLMSRCTRIAGVVLAAALSFAFSGAVAGAQDGTRAFTRTERARLAAGDLVVRPVTKRRGSLLLVGGSSWQVVDAPPDAVWRALGDVPRFRHMLPRVAEARVVSARGHQKTVMIRHEYGVTDARYYLRTRYYPDRRDITFTLDANRRNSLRAAWGFFTVRPYGRDGRKTLLAYGCMADVGDGVIGGFLRPTVHDWMMRVPWTMRRYIEGGGRVRYVSAPRSGG